eukprot:TRINITY_DN12331_c0_g1_i1.p1 TRINITY_DN12331_c0_g1~~TRINITY_DN12331_c0_g1_i1.p1  ORF type:complete len:135 (-),score=42.03 TRINITY_DN12331_c0_g1_i1:126-500(-)
MTEEKRQESDSSIPFIREDIVNSEREIYDEFWKSRIDALNNRIDQAKEHPGTFSIPDEKEKEQDAFFEFSLTSPNYQIPEEVATNQLLLMDLMAKDYENSLQNKSTIEPKVEIDNTTDNKAIEI